MNSSEDDYKKTNADSEDTAAGAGSPDPDECPDDNYDRPVGKASKVDDKWLKKNGIDAHDVKGDALGKVSNFDIYVDREKNCGNFAKVKTRIKVSILGIYKISNSAKGDV
ncbi:MULTISPECIES: polymorphic toxin type 33 domain-containing protein [unclassified Microcoleus]|uniref:polymorphic toxin type 33 domain-containing protein n=1 Tax=unclassified Microcoleus TaxID=2642155 RepID=UPI002FD5619C